MSALKFIISFTFSYISKEGPKVMMMNQMYSEGKKSQNTTTYGMPWACLAIPYLHF